MLSASNALQQHVAPAVSVPLPRLRANSRQRQRAALCCAASTRAAGQAADANVAPEEREQLSPPEAELEAAARTPATSSRQTSGSAASSGPSPGRRTPPVVLQGSGSRQRSDGSGGSADPISGLASNLASLGGAVAQTAARLARQLEPPPPGFPPGPPGDVAVELLSSPLPFLEQLRRRHGTVVGLLLGGERVVLVAEPAAARTVLVDRGDVFVKAGTAFFPGSSLAGNGLLVSDGEVWRRQRRLANPAFRRAAVERYAEAMLASADRLVGGAWRDGVARDLYADFNRLTLEVTLEALFGARLAAGEAAGREITDSIQEAFRFFAARGAAALVIPEWVPTPDNAAFAAAVDRLDRAVFGLISERRRELAEAPRPPADLLDSLLLARDEAGRGMGDREARDEAMTLLVAGQETSAIQLAWSCAYLAHHPAAQAAAAAEVAAVVGGRPLQAADARRLPLVEAVVLEAMRLSPPAYLVGRCAAEATSLGGYRLPQGTTVLVCPHLLHRDPAWWGPDAAAFRPERWLELQQQQQQQQQAAAGCPHAAAAAAGGGGGGAAASASGGGMAFLSGMGPNGAYIPFGAGQRNCIGTGFAMMEAVLVLAAVLQRYKVRPLPGAAFPAAKPQITLRPESARLLLRKR